MFGKSVLPSAKAEAGGHGHAPRPERLILAGQGGLVEQALLRESFFTHPDLAHATTPAGVFGLSDSKEK